MYIKTFSTFSHITRTTTWEDPRKSLAVQASVQHQSAEHLLTSHQGTGTQTPTTGNTGKLFKALCKRNYAQIIRVDFNSHLNDSIAFI